MKSSHKASYKIVKIKNCAEFATLMLGVHSAVSIYALIMASIRGVPPFVQYFGIVYVISSMFLLIPALSFIMPIGLKWADKDTLVMFFYCSLLPQLLFTIAMVYSRLGVDFSIPSIIAAMVLCYLPMRITVRFFVKRGKAYRQKLLDEIAAEEAALPQDS